MGQIIGFAGRMRSGKYELADICEKAGYERLYFALPLKKLIADLIRVDVSEINNLKNVEKEYKFSKMDSMFIANQTAIPYEFINQKISGKTFHTVRELLQFIGTDIIRAYNNDWHVNRIREMVDKDKNYVFDDVRFPNEVNLIRELGGDMWFIIRPDISTVSNHTSETSLKWQDFGDKIIVNDKSLNVFKFKWETFFSHYERSKAARAKFLSSSCAEKWKDVYSELSEMLTTIDLMEISEHWFTYEHRDFRCGEIDKVEQREDGKVIVTYKDESSEIVANPFNIEDLKFCI